MPYTPPLEVTPRLIDLVSRISEAVGRWEGAAAEISPRLRRENRIRSIHASLAIENNTLTLSQVTDIIDGKRVRGHAREITEVKNAVATYEQLDSFDPSSTKDLLRAHRSMMKGLAEDAGRFRAGGVGIYQGTRLVHMAPPSHRVSMLVNELCEWLSTTKTHPILASAVFHYELEFIHPFSDGNGRMGRLWQTCILSRWRPRLAFLPMETVVHARQSEYYAALARSDQAANSSPFSEFILDALLEAIARTSASDPVCDSVSDPVARLCAVFADDEALSIRDMMERMDLRHRTYFRRTFLAPALSAGRLAMTAPDSPHSPRQRYRLFPEK